MVRIIFSFRLFGLLGPLELSFGLVVWTWGPRGELTLVAGKSSRKELGPGPEATTSVRIWFGRASFMSSSTPQPKPSLTHRYSGSGFPETSFFRAIPCKCKHKIPGELHVNILGQLFQ